MFGVSDLSVIMEDFGQYHTIGADAGQPKETGDMLYEFAVVIHSLNALEEQVGCRRGGYNLKNHQDKSNNFTVGDRASWNKRHRSVVKPNLKHTHP